MVKLLCGIIRDLGSYFSTIPTFDLQIQFHFMFHDGCWSFRQEEGRKASVQNTTLLACVAFFKNPSWKFTWYISIYSSRIISSSKASWEIELVIHGNHVLRYELGSIFKSKWESRCWGRNLWLLIHSQYREL